MVLYLGSTPWTHFPHPVSLMALEALQMDHPIVEYASLRQRSTELENVVESMGKRTN